MNIRMLSSNAEQAMREIEQCVALQKAVGWEGEVVPPHVFRADALSRIDSDIDLGYLIIAVEDDDQTVVGFARVTHTGDPACHWLHEIVVAPNNQSRGVGYLLMSGMQKASCSLGAREILFTYDPFESQNGYLYLTKCGAKAIKVYENLYGEIHSSAHGNRLTHRFLVRWVLVNDTPISTAEHSALMQAPLVCEPTQLNDQPRVRVEIPYTVQSLSEAEAVNWQRRVFPVLVAGINQHSYHATAVLVEDRHSYLVLETRLL